MAEAGFYGDFIAKSEGATYKGVINKDGSIKSVKVRSVSESKEQIKRIFEK